jgi:uncharacterized protein
MSTEKLEQTIVWRRLDAPGHDGCALWSRADGWRIEGTALFSLDGVPCHLNYEVDCDAKWRARVANVDGWMGTAPVELEIIGIPEQRWMLNGAEQAEASGCVDLDLGFTPATNLIALRRLALETGEESDAPAAWLGFPDPKLTRLEQHYRRVSRERYDYRSPGVGYAACLDVTETGFVTHYPGLWVMESFRQVASMP